MVIILIRYGGHITGNFMKKIVFTLLLAGSFLFVSGFTTAVRSCVGRILTLTVNNTAEQKLIGQMLATYITERTGTTVTLLFPTDKKSARKEAGKCQSDICIQYLDTGLSFMDVPAAGTERESYEVVKQYFIDKKNMVWLNPLGYSGSVDQDSRSWAIPVVDRDALDRFPLLERVINKLSGRVNDATVRRLLEQAETSDLSVVVKEFLKQENLI